LTDAGTPCARFRDRGMSADAPKSHCDNTLFLSVLTGLHLSECNWTIFIRARRPAATKRPSSMFRRVGRAEAAIRTASRGAWLKVTRHLWLHSKVPFLAIFNQDHDSRVRVQPRSRSFDARLERALAAAMLDPSVATAADMVTVNIDNMREVCGDGIAFALPSASRHSR
jgi:hypothetical protein